MKKYFGYVVLFLVFVICFLGSLAFFRIETENKTLSIVSELAITINGSSTDTFPNKDSGLKVSNISCNENVVAYWDYTSWSLRVRNLSNTRTKCNVDFKTEYSESLLNGTDPVLKEGLIPVTIESDGTVHKANLASEWYRYGKKVWANAVILEDESKTYYDGEVIPEGNIESYFVWIPRYKYKIFNEGNYTSLNSTTYQNHAQEIEIIFENKSTAVSNGTTVGSYLTHPAFTAFNTNGMWVGKFETGYQDLSTNNSEMPNQVHVDKIVIKPGVKSWYNIQTAYSHLNSYQYQRNLDSHMMKNTEWGAVAYLQYSKYGGMHSVRTNNNSNRRTGYASIIEHTCGYTGTNESCNQYGATNDITVPYNTTIGYLASTTANISGIYDMSGGLWENTMSFTKTKENEIYIGTSMKYNSGFTGWLGCPTCHGEDGTVNFHEGLPLPDQKYYDLYPYTTQDQFYANRILGDALGELGPIYLLNSLAVIWNYDRTNAINNSSPIIKRGGAWENGYNAGIFAAANVAGNANNDTGFRIVLSF